MSTPTGRRASSLGRPARGDRSGGVQQYLELEKIISQGAPGWHEALERIGLPGVLVDNVHTSFAGSSATLLADPRWVCVWFDPVATVFVPVSSSGAGQRLDFAARHFSGVPRTGLAGGSLLATLDAEARAAFEIAYNMVQRGQGVAARDLILYAIGLAQEFVRLAPNDPNAWKRLSLLESVRENVGSPEHPVARWRMAWDPVFDLSAARAAATLRQALALNPDDSKCLLTLVSLLQARGADDAALPVVEHLAAVDPPNQIRAVTQAAQEIMRAQAAAIRERLGTEPSSQWKNRDELAASIQARRDRGWAHSAAVLLEAAYPERARSWSIADQIATIWMNLGEPARAAQAWSTAAEVPRPALRDARLAAAAYARNELAEAARLYRQALQVEPLLFEALYGLAVVERDAGHAKGSAAAAQAAVSSAGSRPAEAAARAVLEQVKPHAGVRPAGA